MAAKTKTKTVVLTGPMSSGCRVLRDLLTEGGIFVLFDYSHGSQPLPLNWDSYPVVIITRDEIPTRRSAHAAWYGSSSYVSYEDSIAGLQGYRNAIRVNYEEMCNHIYRFIRRLASRLSVKPWNTSINFINQNGKWLERERLAG